MKWDVKSSDKLTLLLVTDSYKPQICSASSLMSELAEELVQHGHSVTVLTMQPDSRISSIEREEKFPSFETMNGVRIIRIDLPPTHTKSFLVRGINTVLGSWILPRKAYKVIANDHIDAVICYSPPINLVISASKIAKTKGAKLIILLRDLFPQNAIDLGILKNRLAISYFEKIEKMAYSVADFILPQSDTNKDFLLNVKKVPLEKVHVLFNWVNIRAYMNPTRIDFRREFGLDGKKVCLYAGTMGPAQGLERILDAASILEKEPILFLFVGNGRNKQKLVDESKKRGLHNVIFKDYVQPDLYPDLVRSCDIGIISLSSENHTPIVPGKLASYMAGGLPVIALINKESTDMAAIIGESECGKYIIGDNVELFASEILSMIKKPEILKKYRNNALQYVKEMFSVEHAARIITDLVSKKG
ncbi:MAG: glycosyltransferase family 4 protein [Bacteroidales bacterium]|nr:glycosyltransferase family 4 protein [Bacteroidales bacterium]